LELCALGALGYWGFKTGSVTSTKVVLGVGAPLVATVVWGTFLSPSAPPDKWVVNSYPAHFETTNLRASFE
jgi:hypothetical protein